jgi:hypothetical protein
MTNQHPITPPPELIEQWMQAHSTKYDLARHAAQWGADMELEACLRYAGDNGLSITRMRATRRRQPPSLKEQALGALGRFNTNTHTRADEMTQDFDLIRRALEALDD